MSLDVHVILLTTCEKIPTPLAGDVLIGVLLKVFLALENLAALEANCLRPLGVACVVEPETGLFGEFAAAKLAGIIVFGQVDKVHLLHMGNQGTASGALDVAFVAVVFGMALHVCFQGTTGEKVFVARLALVILLFARLFVVLGRLF